MTIVYFPSEIFIWISSYRVLEIPLKCLRKCCLYASLLFIVFTLAVHIANVKCQPRQTTVLTFDTLHVYVTASAMIPHCLQKKKTQQQQQQKKISPNYWLRCTKPLYWALTKWQGLGQTLPLGRFTSIRFFSCTLGSHPRWLEISCRDCQEKLPALLGGSLRWIIDLHTKRLHV